MKTSDPTSRRSPILSTGSLREMHRVRVLENSWTQATPSASPFPVGEVVCFVEGNGRVVHITTGDSYVERVRQ